MAVHMFSRDTVWHYAAGVAAYFCGVSSFDFMVYHAAFEVMDGITGHFLYRTRNRFIQNVGDVLMGQVGWVMSKWCYDEVR